MLHFGRRGRENLSNLTRKHFAVKCGADEKLYVYKVIDERTKNHQSDSELSSDGRMYEITDGERCPVKSFVKYIRRLNPKCVKLFQQARSYPKEDVYYDDVPLGHNRLGQFMNEISKMASLSLLYTNHSCRATTVHLLDGADIPSRHIMTVTGHKSETFLKTYSGKTCEKNKRHMSEIISSKTCGKKSCISNIDFPCLSQSTITVEGEENHEHIPVDLNDANFELELLSNSQSETVMKDISPNDQCDEILTEIGNGASKRNTNIMKPETLMPNPICLKEPHPDMKMPFLINCSNVTVNINYNVHPYVNNPAKNYVIKTNAEQLHQRNDSIPMDTEHKAKKDIAVAVQRQNEKITRYTRGPTVLQKESFIEDVVIEHNTTFTQPMYGDDINSLSNIAFSEQVGEFTGVASSELAPNKVPGNVQHLPSNEQHVPTVINTTQMSKSILQESKNINNELVNRDTTNTQIKDGKHYPT
ncbi:unnamed protein product [Mytilus coruscus]|uniref:KCTD1_15 n=1 Tax=Mytilus coruscus TaxID=42192 RepID=A0A6J8CSJ5_MYTCO|nr:unnamed protein product [Mytilus coruscus]